MNKTQKFFFLAFLINITYLIITFIFFYGLDSSLMNKNTNDYLTFHNAGLLAIRDISNLYNSSLYIFPFRYFPLSAYIFTPFSALGLDGGYFVFQLFNFSLGMINLYIIYKIIKIIKRETSMESFNLVKFRYVFSDPKNESILHQYAIILIILPQFMNYFLGQINILVSFFILLSLLYFLKKGIKNDFLGGLFLGFGILLKPTLILILPFVILLNYNKENKRYDFDFKRSIIRLLGPIVLLMSSWIYFLLFPQMFDDFIEVNLGGKYTYTIEGGLEINPSFSLTRIILTLAEIFGAKLNGFLTLVTITLLILIPTYYLFIHNSNKSTKLVEGYLGGILVMLIVYFDSWPHHIVVLAPFLAFFLLFHKNFKFYKMIKSLYYLLAVLIVIFWGIFYLTYEFLPMNIGGMVLILTLYSYFLFYLKKNSSKSQLEFPFNNV